MTWVNHGGRPGTGGGERRAGTRRPARERPPFDPTRAAFLLVAMVIGVHCLIALSAMGVCVWRVVNIAPDLECDAKSRLGDLLAGALAAALAFGGSRKPPDPPSTKGPPSP